jgi:hypothetical protein
LRTYITDEGIFLDKPIVTTHGDVDVQIVPIQASRLGNEDLSLEWEVLPILVEPCRQTVLDNLEPEFGVGTKESRVDGRAGRSKVVEQTLMSAAGREEGEVGVGVVGELKRTARAFCDRGLRAPDEVDNTVGIFGQVPEL